MRKFYDEGFSPKQCRAKFGFAYNAWRKAVTRGAIDLRAEDALSIDRRSRYNWTEIAAYYERGHSLYDCAKKFGFCISAWSKAVKRGDIKARSLKPPLPQVLQHGNRSAIKRRLLQDGILKNQCSRCGITEWRGNPISIQLDHINGINDDYRLENLRMLCPNCHILTETYGARNVKRKPVSP